MPDYTNPNRAWQEGVGAPASTATAAPTIASIYGNVSENDRFIDSSTGYYKGIAETPVDESKIREDVMRRLQSEIDATNSIYAQKLATVRRQGEGRLGSDAAIQSRRGLIGSDFGAGQTGQVTALNNEIEGGVQAEQAAAIAALYSKGESTIKSELEAKNAARAQGADAYIQFLNESEKRRSARTATAAQLALASGIDLTTLDQAGLKKLADSYQVSVDQLLQTYGTLSDAKAQEEAAAAAAEAKAALDAEKIRSGIAVDRSTIDKNSRVELGEGQALFDAAGNRIAYNPKTFAPVAGAASGANGIVDANGKPIKLTAGQVDTIAGFDNVTRAATEALALLSSKKVQTGPVAGLLLQGKKVSDKADPDQLSLEQSLAKIKADFMKAISGAAVSESEARRLARFLPDIYDQEGVLTTKLNTLINESKKNRDTFLSTLGAAGPASPDGTDLAQQVSAAGYDYAQMRADGHSDDEIRAAIGL